MSGRKSVPTRSRAASNPAVIPAKAGIHPTRVRAALYRLFSAAFREPRPAVVEPEVVAELLRELPDGDRIPLVPVVPGDPVTEIRRVFGHNLSPDCSPYETQYGGLEVFRQSQTLADLAGFYRAFGVEPSEGNRRPDSLAVELEFMSFLCLKEALAAESPPRGIQTGEGVPPLRGDRARSDHQRGEAHMESPPEAGAAGERGEGERAALCREARSRFLGRHLGAWVPAFAAAVEAKAPGSYYAGVARTLSAFVALECETLKVNPSGQAVPSAWSPTPPADDPCLSCFGGAG